jgi:two-component system sensor histidine kinase PilS (NtrC family)
VILMGARLALASASLVLGLVLESVGGHITISEWHGFYGAVVVAFLATLVYWPLHGRVGDVRRFAAINIATDIALVSALVFFSGGGESVFTFLYVAVIAYAALLLERSRAIGCALAASAAYGAVLLAGMLGHGDGANEHVSLLAARWILHSGALFLVAALATRLVAELEHAGAALSQRTSDLVQLQTLHQRTVESLMSGLLTTDPEGRITSFNLEAERITGLSRSEVRGGDMNAALPGLRALIEVSGSGPGDLRSRSRMRYVDRRGEERHLGIGAYSLRGDDGEPGGLVVIFQDLTDVVQMERDLRRSERLAAVGELSASIAHEIRNPLAAISGSVQVLQRTLRDLGEEPARLMSIVLREIERLDRLITDFLSFARPRPLRAERVSLARLVDETLDAFEAARPEGVLLERSLDRGLQVQADPAQLRQAIWNLVINACQAMPEGGRLAVCVRAVSDAPAQGGGSAYRTSVVEEKPAVAEIAVMDQGGGIADDALEHVFDPFFTTKRDGSGLGLAVVHRVVAEHGGSVRLERARVPWSTVVRILLPGAERSA